MIAQTLAFVQTVTGKKEDAGRPLARLEAATPELEYASLDAIRDALDMLDPSRAAPKQAFNQALTNPPQAAPPKSIPAARPIVPSELQREIQSRIEGFRAHQERFNRERAEYFNATLARVRATLDDAPERATADSASVRPLYRARIFAILTRFVEANRNPPRIMCGQALA